VEESIEGEAERKGRVLVTNLVRRRLLTRKGALRGRARLCWRGIEPPEEKKERKTSEEEGPLEKKSFSLEEPKEGGGRSVFPQRGGTSF